MIKYPQEGDPVKISWNPTFYRNVNFWSGISFSIVGLVLLSGTFNRLISALFLVAGIGLLLTAILNLVRKPSGK
jgi:hypothetical protein